MAGVAPSENSWSSDGPSWSDIAVWYDDLLKAGSGPHQTAAECLLDLAPSLNGDERLLDLACGQGFASRAFLAAGAGEVVGTDYSAAMIERAVANGPPEGTDPSALSYVVDDGQVLSRFDDGDFDGVVCQLGIMDIPDLGATLRAVRRVLKPGGWFVFVISHPCFLAPQASHVEVTVSGDDGRVPAVAVHTYLTEQFWRSTNPEGVRRAGNHHRTVSTYVNELAAAGFDIERFAEPRANEVLAERSPIYGEVPIFLAARVRSKR